jgi:hypothetical protein
MDAVGAIVTSKPLDTAALIEALRAEALRRSRNQVKALLKSRGVKLSDWSRAGLDREARVWLDGHRQELMGAVLGEMLWNRVADILSAEQKIEAGKSGLSRVQMSGSKWSVS